MSGYYAIDSVGANPYFLGAYNSPNMNYVPSFQGTTSPQATVTAADTATVDNSTNVPRKKEEKKDNTTAKLIVGTALTIGAACLCRKAYKAGNGTGTIEKIFDGFGQWGQNIKNLGKKAKDKVISPEKFSVTQIGDKTVCTIPGRAQAIRGVEGATDKLAQVGATADVPALTDAAGKLAEGIKIKNGTFVFDGKTFIVNKGKITGIEGMAEDAFKDLYKLPKTQENIELKTKINEALAKFTKGELIGQQGTTITQFSHSKDGVSRLFNQNTTGGYDLRCGVTNRFNVNSDPVLALRHDNPTVDTALKSFAEHKTDGLKLATAEYTSPELGTLFIKNGEITSIKKPDGTICEKGSEAWKALMQKNKEIYENILQDTASLQNKVYHLA